ncbi:MAG: hypothetical protein HZB80_11800 [Deltaproteobacteria bacterium]|nr:hypothetical protein [Deltaproteobacteria bacterium]
MDSRFRGNDNFLVQFGFFRSLLDAAYYETIVDAINKLTFSSFLRKLESGKIKDLCMPASAGMAESLSL